MDVKATPEDPAEKAANAAEATRANAALVSTTQDNLTDEDMRKQRLMGNYPGGASATGGSSGQFVAFGGGIPLASGVGVTGSGMSLASSGGMASAGGGGGRTFSSGGGRIAMA